MAAPPLDEEAIFSAALECASAERLAAYLDGACAGDGALRRRVEALLRLRGAHESFLAEPAVLGECPQGAPLHENASGAAVGRYRLLERIGEGGFGAVYMAEQTEPVKRRVALKVIKAGMDTRQVIARFEAERQALAMMDHPNIAKVLDAGATEAQSPLGPGRPYFVMELVKGVPITRFCDDERLVLRERLRLFMDACQAVQHAHQKGIIHRDLKPSNVLVSRYDDKPVVKIIDFGIAKATGGSVGLTDKTLFTEFRQLIGTPAYMSPEQAGLSDLDIDTRSDIYALGVLLYELLTGTTPFEAERLRSAGFDEMRRIIREEEPPKPSTRLSLGAKASRKQGIEVSGSQGVGATDSGALGTSTPGHLDTSLVAAHRRADPVQLVRSVRGDLDWIVMRCLEKDRTRRYETANGLALDVERHVRNEPVLAGPPTRRYRVRKFVRRNRAMVTGAALVTGTLLAGTAGTAYGLLRAEHRRAEAEHAQGLAEKRQKETQHVADFQAAMLAEIDAEAMGAGIRKRFREQVRAALERLYVGEGAERRKRTPEEIDAELAAFDAHAGAARAADVARGVMDELVLAHAAEELTTQFADQPLVQAQLNNSLGAAYKGLGLFREAEPYLRAALETHRRELGDDDPATLIVVANVGGVLLAQSRYAEAEPYYLETLERRRRVLGPEHPDTLRAINGMGLLLHSRGSLSEAEPYYREVLEVRRRTLGNEHEETLATIDNLGALLARQNRPDEAEPLHREALDGLRRTLGNDHPGTLTCLNNLGVLLKDQGRLDEAEPLLLEALERRRRVLGDDHPDTLGSIGNLGDLRHYQGRLDDAERLHGEALAQFRRTLGDEHVDTLIATNNLGYVLRDQGRLAEAERVFAEGTRAARAGLGDHPMTGALEHHHADVLVRAGRSVEAIDLARAAVERYQAHPDWNIREALHAFDVLVAALRGVGRASEAIEMSWKRIETERPWFAKTPPANMASALATFAAEALAAGDRAWLGRAEQAARESLEIRREVFPDGHAEVWRRYNVMSLLGEVLVRLAEDPSVPARADMLREAESLLIAAWEGLKNDPNLPPPSAGGGDKRRATLERIVKLYEVWHAAEPDKGHDAKAAEWRAELEKLSKP